MDILQEKRELVGKSAEIVHIAKVKIENNDSTLIRFVRY